MVSLVGIGREDGGESNYAVSTHEVLVADFTLKTNECPEGELYWICGQQHGPLGRPIPRPVMAEMGGGEIG
ncbi:MAG: hypothetical protein CL434_12575 [Acidimicrobiaceae bacterium]|jgi:hypothetical protein|nr:hypothetical protein [Acidimicrobiaceae bacterium]